MPTLHYRHTLPVRVMHWINVISLACLFLSGLGIFNAYPELHLGKSSYTGHPPVLAIGAEETSGAMRGVTTLFGHRFDTTGFLGWFPNADGGDDRAFPSWLTLPGDYWLQMSRQWHFFFAWLFVLNGIAYLAYGFASRHLRRDLVPSGDELRGIGGSIRDHLRFRHPTGEAATRYNVLQKLAYLAVIFVLLPLVILTGWSMSPQLNAAFAGWVDLLGGRHTGRTIHFIVAWLLVAFAAIHVFMVLVTGVVNQLRAMITGWYRVEH